MSEDELRTLAAEVLEGLSASPKRLPSHWFYDEAGSALFERIMALPEYYLTRAERGLLARDGEALMRRLAAGAEALQLVELGSGNGAKTLLLCQAMERLGLRWSYAPIDLSAAALEELQRRFAAALPAAALAGMQPLRGDFHRLWPAHRPGCRQIALFMGSNLGNLDTAAALSLLVQLRERLLRGDCLLLGLDLQKHPKRILRAYDDGEGLTARFNLNLLQRLNRELGMDFVIEDFEHYASYSPLDGAARSFLVSRRRQSVRSLRLGREFGFEAGECIYTEQSQKYTAASAAALLGEAGFQLAETLVDADEGYAIFVGSAC